MILTFDIGTTALKTALIDRDGLMRAVHTEEYTFSTPGGNRAEMDARLYLTAAERGARAVLAAAGTAGRDVLAIGFSSQGQSFIPIDASGRPLHPAIIWVDTRAREIAREWEGTVVSRDEFRLATGYPWLSPELTVFKIAWLARHARDAHEAWKFLCLPDYLIYSFTGECATDPVMAQFSGMLDLRIGAWNGAFADAMGIEIRRLPDVLPCGSVCGSLRTSAADALGLRAGIPVCVGANDQIAGAVGCGNVCPGLVSETTGTALAVVVTSERRLDDTRYVSGRHAAEDAWFAMPFGITSAVVLKWLRDISSPSAGYEDFLAGIDAIPPGSEGVTVLPHFAGTATPTFLSDARGVVAGLSLSHTRAHVSRAIMESCACMLRECLDTVAEGEATTAGVRAIGGAARSDAWLQMKADMLGIAIERPACPDAASLGAGMLAAYGLGWFSSVKEASQAWYRTARIFEPDNSRRRVYDSLYERYRALQTYVYEHALLPPATKED